MTFHIDHDMFDQSAIDRYMASNVIRRIEEKIPLIEGLEIPPINRAEWAIKTISRLYPPNSNETEMPLMIEYFCNAVMEDATMLKKALKSNFERGMTFNPIEHAKTYATELYKAIDVPVTLMGHEVDPKGQFAQVFQYIRDQYSNALAVIPLAAPSGSRSECRTTQSACEEAFGELIQAATALCNRIRQTIDLPEPTIK